MQRFISEARSTADVRAASEIVTALASSAAAECRAAGGELVFPSSAGDGSDSAEDGESPMPVDDARDGMPNRVVALAPPGGGADVARRAVAAARRAWDSWVQQALAPDAETRDASGTSATPGFPVIQWVCVPALPEGYPAQWARARDLLDARRRVRDFSPVSWSRRTLCALSPRWPAEPVPEGLKEHEKDTLSAANWVKRRWRRIQDKDGFASTSSIASAGYRRDVAALLDNAEVAAALSELMSAAPG